MARNQRGKWRTLDDLEIALVKGMKLCGYPRDRIISFFVRPGRTISPAVVSELDAKRPDVVPATKEEVQFFVSRKLNEANLETKDHGFSPTSSIRVREILQTSQDTSGTLPGFESLFAELKREVPNDKAGKAKIAKALTSFANHEGGYLFVGVDNDGQVLGVPDAINAERFWDEIADVVTRHFTPFFQWERNVVFVDEKRILVAYVSKSLEKPIIASAQYTGEILPGVIYFRYNRSSEAIHPGDLINLLHERDRRVVATAVATEKLKAEG